VLAVGAVLAAGLTGCSAAYEIGPAGTVRDLFLYVRIGALESAWQEFGPAMQASLVAHPAVAPDGRTGVSLHWPSVAAFRVRIEGELAPFLRGARVQASESVATATAVAEAVPPARARAYFALVRVDNEWVIQRVIVVGVADETR
jgi:hypothetical protein